MVTFSCPFRVTGITHLRFTSYSTPLQSFPSLIEVCTILYRSSFLAFITSILHPIDNLLDMSFLSPSALLIMSKCHQVLYHCCLFMSQSGHSSFISHSHPSNPGLHVRASSKGDFSMSFAKAGGVLYFTRPTLSALYVSL